MSIIGYHYSLVIDMSPCSWS